MILQETKSKLVRPRSALGFKTGNTSMYSHAREGEKQAAFIRIRTRHGLFLLLLIVLREEEKKNDDDDDDDVRDRCMP